jgi:hypothetical protein
MSFDWIRIGSSGWFLQYSNESLESIKVCDLFKEVLSRLVPSSAFSVSMYNTPYISTPLLFTHIHTQLPST